MTAGRADALVLDCDGVLADTERHGHLVAFNQTFAEFGLPVRWSVAEYQRKLQIGGGKERLASLLTPEFIAAAGLSADAAEQQAAISAWHRRNT
jgi:beta-phosphoglucomutase-like phosphatase (HAD superfamily)